MAVNLSKSFEACAGRTRQKPTQGAKKWRIYSKNCMAENSSYFICSKIFQKRSKNFKKSFYLFVQIPIFINIICILYLSACVIIQTNIFWEKSEILDQYGHQEGAVQCAHLCSSIKTAAGLISIENILNR